MNRQTFQQFMEAKQFKVYGMYAFGMIQEYPVTVINNGSKIWNLIFTVELDDPKHQAKELRRDCGKKYNFIPNKTGLVVSVKVKDKQAEQDFVTAAREIMMLLHQKGIRPTRTCAFCRQGGCDVLVVHGNGYVPAHRHCVDNMTAQTVSKAQNSDVNGNYITGVIGAILGAIVGTLPSLLTILAMRTLYSMLFALIPLCIYGGYKLFKGKMNKFVIVQTVILSILSVVLLYAEQFMYYWMHYYDAAFGEAFAALGDYMKESVFWTDMISSSILEFVFIGLGIMIAWGQISKTSVSEIQNAEEIRRTMVPYGKDIY